MSQVLALIGPSARGALTHARQLNAAAWEAQITKVILTTPV